MTVHQLTADPDTTDPDDVPEGTLYDPDVFTCNSYLVVGERTTLVDAGTLPGIVDAIREHTTDLDTVVLTHQHGDHVGQLHAVLDAFDPALACYGDHPDRTTALDHGDVMQLGDGSYEVVYTPGHAADHVSFLGERALFSGDVVVPNDEAFDYASFGSAAPGTQRERLIESLERLLDRFEDSVESLYAGHGAPFSGDVRDVLETALERAETREPKYG